MLLLIRFLSPLRAWVRKWDLARVVQIDVVKCRGIESTQPRRHRHAILPRNQWLIFLPLLHPLSISLLTDCSTGCVFVSLGLEKLFLGGQGGAGEESR